VTLDQTLRAKNLPVLLSRRFEVISLFFLAASHQVDQTFDIWQDRAASVLGKAKARQASGKTASFC
jgi:hypothetical protein